MNTPLVIKRALPPKRHNHDDARNLADRSPTVNSALIDAALEYYKLGLAIIPILGKAPAFGVRWKNYRISGERPCQRELHQWFDDGPVTGVVTGMAVLLGELSRGLCCLDFDVPGPFAKWSSGNPALANRLPTAKTSRGFHVYFLTSEVVQTKKLSFGEVRGEGSYTVLPPSTHPGGHTYEWVRTFETEGALDEVSLAAVATWHSATRTFPLASQARQLPRSKDCIGSLSQAIAAAVPTKPRSNDACLFLLARALLALEADGPLGLEVEMRAFDDWFQKTGDAGYLRESREDYLEKFLRARNNAKRPLGESALADAWTRSQSEPMPQEEASRLVACRSKMISGLQSLCWQLSLGAGGGVWFLASGSAGPLLGCTGMTVCNLLATLVRFGVLTVVERGTMHKATRYRYLPVKSKTENKGRIE